MRRMKCALVFSLLAALVIATPLENTTEDSKHTVLNSTEVTPSQPCKNFVDNHDIPQLVFPSCTSMHSSMSLRNVVLHGMACTCDINTHDVQKRDDYHYSPGIGAHKLHTIGTTFNKARQICNDEGGHLAIIESRAEEQVLLELFSKAENMRNVANNEEAFIGIHDLYSEGEWVTILGDSFHKTGYTKWSNRWGGQPDNGGNVQHCGALMKDGGMDDVNCNINFAFFCEIPSVRIAHY